MHIPAYSNLSLVRWPGSSEDDQILHSGTGTPRGFLLTRMRSKKKDRTLTLTLIARGNKTTFLCSENGAGLVAVSC